MTLVTIGPAAISFLIGICRLKKMFWRPKSVKVRGYYLTMVAVAPLTVSVLEIWPWHIR